MRIEWRLDENWKDALSQGNRLPIRDPNRIHPNASLDFAITFISRHILSVCIPYCTFDHVCFFTMAEIRDLSIMRSFMHFVRRTKRPDTTVQSLNRLGSPWPYNQPLALNMLHKERTGLQATSLGRCSCQQIAWFLEYNYFVTFCGTDLKRE